MIPRIIHYCWFGESPPQESELACLESWETLLPDFQFRLWNEDSIDLGQYPFAQEAYDSGKFAFVSDVVRLHALYYEGGIYLDTDVILIRNIEELLGLSFFTGEYKAGALNAAVIGSSAFHPVLKEMLAFYKLQKFDFLKPLTIPEVFDQFVWGHKQESVRILPPSYFYPLPLENKGDDFAEYIKAETYGVHLWNHSWKDEFVLLRQDEIFKSIKLALHHIKQYPNTYRNKAYLYRYITFFIRSIRRILKFKLQIRG